ncbi:MAG: gliding motility-associated C-terminal domain-containing protein [Bacteroidota bacterium]
MNRHSLNYLFGMFNLNTKPYFLVLFALLCVRVFIHAQIPSPTILSQKTLGGTLNETLNTTYATSDGGYVLGGQTASANGDVSSSRRGLLDAWVVKTNATGIIEWQISLGGSRDDIVTSVKETSDQGFIVEGYSASTDGDFSSNHGGVDIFVSKLSKTGSIEWTKCFGGSRDERSSEIVVSIEGGYLFTGSTKSANGDINGSPTDEDVWVVKINSSGTIQWQRLIQGTFTDICKAVKQMPDKNYFLVSNIGTVAGTNQREDIFVSKIATNGNVMGQWSYGGNRQDFAASLELTPDGGFVILGKTNSNNGTITKNQGNFDVWILKMSATGTMQWQKTFGGSQYECGSGAETFGGIEATDDGGYVFTSSTNSIDGDIQVPTTPWSSTQARVWVVKLNCKQEIQWQKILGGESGDYGITVKQNTDKSYFVGANATSNDGDVLGNKGSRDFWLLKLSPDPKPKAQLIASGPLTFCDGKSVQLDANIGTQYKYQWQKDGTDILGEINPKITISQSGDYKVLLVPKDCPKPQTDTSAKVVVTPKPDLHLPNDTTFCANPMKLQASTINGASYLWSTGEISSVITPTNSGKYVLKVSVGGCDIKDSSNVKRSNPPVVSLSSQIQECFDASKPYILNAGNDLTLHYRWSPNNETSNNINISQEGIYKVKVTNSDGCSTEKSVEMILRCVSKIYAPNIFTPNGDGNNETFWVLAQDVTDYELKIYNRWGELIFISAAESEVWDGTYHAEKAPEGTYSWQLTYKNINQPTEILKHSGTILLTR